MKKIEHKSYEFYDDKGYKCENELQARISDFVNAQVAYLAMVGAILPQNHTNANFRTAIEQMKNNMLKSLVKDTSECPIENAFNEMMVNGIGLRDYVGRIANTSSFDEKGNAVKTKSTF